MNKALANSRPAEILLVEDNQNDVILTREGFKRSKLMVNLTCVENGEQCMAFLRKEPPYADAPTPDVILLDLNMPIMDGRQVLEEIDKDENLNHLPVVILTTSDAEADILDMYKLRASSYIIKPVDFNNFLDVIQGITNYWFTVVVLPSS